MTAIWVLAIAALCLTASIGALIVYAIACDRRQRRLFPSLSERAVRSSQDPGEYGADISVWPSRAPRNGTTYDTVD